MVSDQSGIDLQPEVAETKFSECSSAVGRTCTCLSDSFGMLDKTYGYLEWTWSKAKVISPLAVDGNDVSAANAETPERLAALRERLHALGYYVQDKGQKKNAPVDDALKKALVTFQIECNLMWQNGVLTVETWDNLNELFDFETPMKTERWFNNGIPEKPLTRAVNLRLNAYGFSPKSNITDEDSQLDEDALERFAKVVEPLGGRYSGLAGIGLTENLATALFDFDGLTTRLSTVNGDGLGPKDGLSILLAHVGMIEVWLNGYDIKLKTAANKLLDNVSRGTPSGSLPKEAKVFSSFLNDNKSTRKDIQKNRTRGVFEMIPDVLRVSCEIREANPPTASGDETEALISDARMQIEKDTSAWKAICNAATKAVSSLFDGFRRAFSWLKSVVKRGWKWFKKKTNAAAYKVWRILHHYAGAAAFYLKKMTRVFELGIDFVINGNGLPSYEHILFRRGKDFDFFLIADSAMVSSEATRFVNYLGCAGKCVRIAGIIISTMLSSVIAVVKTIVKAGINALYGVYSAIMGLAQIYRKIREIVVLLDEVDLSIFDVQKVAVR